MYCIYRKYINALTSILIILLHHISELCTGKRHSHFLQKVHMLLCVPYIKIVLWPVLLVLFEGLCCEIQYSAGVHYCAVRSFPKPPDVHFTGIFKAGSAYPCI